MATWGRTAEHEVSIKSVRHEGHGDQVQPVIITHRAAERDLHACVADLEASTR